MFTKLDLKFFEYRLLTRRSPNVSSPFSHRAQIHASFFARRQPMNLTVVNELLHREE